MSNYFLFIIFIFIIIKINIIKPLCVENSNNCLKCNPLTNICAKCISQNFYPDQNGGCEGICRVGNNYCLECEDDGKICLKCEENYFPDRTGGCSYTNNCQLSNKGNCLNCINGYILFGEGNGPKICKSLNSEDLKNCKKINNISGLCEECNEGFYLNPGDSKCVETKNCYESSFGLCISCDVGYYLNKKKDICEKTINDLLFCKQTLDEKNCDICHFGFYLSEDGQCTDTINCSKTEGGKCIECKENNYLINEICTIEKNCKKADKDTGLCELCNEGFYLDKKDRKCKSNKEDNEYKYCEIYDEKCIKCQNWYFVGEDSKCSQTEKCSQSENGVCLECINDYYLGDDNKCTNIEHCISSGKTKYGCDECEKNYYFDRVNMTCNEEIDNLKNCKIAITWDNITRCSICRNNYYLNRTDYLCYDNSDENNKYYKCISTNFDNLCEECEKGLYLNFGDRKCTLGVGCKIAENWKKCIECEKNYCLDIKKGICKDNDFIEDESEKIYINCNKTNKEGTACEECLEGYEVGDEGFCIDVDHCEKKENGICVKCKEGDYFNGTFYCLNSVFGCMNTFIQFCSKCDNIMDLFSCTECEEGFEVNDYGICI